MYCGHCGNKVEDGERFCGSCGYPIEGAGRTGKVNHGGNTVRRTTGAAGGFAQSVGQLNRGAEKIVPRFLRNLLPKVPALCFAAAYVLIPVVIIVIILSAGGIKLSGYNCFACGDQRSEHYYSTGYGNNIMCEDCATLYWLAYPGAMESHRIY